MSRREDPATEVARFLRQRGELGSSDLFLDGLSREDALRLAGEARRMAAEGPRTPSMPDPQTPPRAESKAPSMAESKAPAMTTGALPASYDEVRTMALACTQCRLHETRQQVVFSDGNASADLVVVGEAPGANEDATGVPFVGVAGQFLDLLLATLDLSRKDSVYICNVLKCRPPGNRNPQPGEIEACTPFLVKQIELVSPKALLAVGTFSAQFLTGQQKALGKLRGEVHAYQGVPLVVTYHPAALLRNSKWTRSFWEDLQLLRQVMDGA